MAGTCSLSSNMIRWKSWYSHFVPGHRPIWGSEHNGRDNCAVRQCVGQNCLSEKDTRARVWRLVMG